MVESAPHAAGQRLVAEGRDLLDRGQVPRARAALEHAVKRCPGCWEGWLLLGIAAREQRDWEAQEWALGRALALRPDHAAARSEYSLVLLALGRRVDALHNAQVAADAAISDAAVWSNRAVVEIELGRRDEAERSLDHAVRLAPDDPVVRACQRELRRRSRRESWQPGASGEGEALT